MRSSANRAAKYDAKAIGDIAKNRLDNYGDTQKAQFRMAMKRQVDIENTVRTIINADAGTLLYHVSYIIFGKELNKIAGKYQGLTLNREAELLQDKWISRGLDPDVLLAIKLALGWLPEYHLFRLDVSLLDGDDRLA